MHRIEVLSGPWTDRTLRAMGCECRIVVGDAPDGLADWAVDELARCEGSWSRFRPDSELALLNASPAAEVAVSARLAEALAAAVALWRATDGWFDPTVLDALEAWGYDRTFESVRAGTPIVARPGRPAKGCASVEVGDDVVRRPPGLRFDLGGVGKGLAADRLAEGLVHRGARTAIVSIGGDVRAAGDAPAGGWSVPVEHPDTGAPMARVALHGGALVQSTDRFRRWTVSTGRGTERTAHHLIDPFRGEPGAGGLGAVAVHGDEAWWAEGLAKAALLAGRTAGATLLRHHGVEAWTMADDGTVTHVRAAPTDPDRRTAAAVAA